MNTPELIVRQIAADRYPHGVHSERCRYCSVPARDSHLLLCVWRQAKEWVEAEHGRGISDYYARMAAENKDSGD